MCKEIAFQPGFNTVQQSLDQYIVSADRNTLVFIIEIVVVEHQADRQTFDDECRKFRTFSSPLFFGVSLDQCLVDIFSNEKLGLILAYYVEDSEEAVLRRCVEILEWEGAGHTFAIHTEDADTAKRFAAAVPASRVLVNTPAALGGIGATTCLFPALTLGCGAVGGSSSSNNIGPLDLINIKRVAWGVKELEELRGNRPAAGYAPCAVDESLLNELVNRIIGRLSV